MSQKLISIVIPVLNEAATLDALIARVSSVLAKILERWEIVFVDDGSTDGTMAKLRECHASDPRITAVSFSRNFGKELAIAAGLSYVRGDAAIIMDADLQDPPELLDSMIEQFRQGFDVVSTQRIARDGESIFKKVTASAFYSFMQKAIDERLPPQCGDFRLFSRGAVQAIRKFREQHRFMRGLVAWLGLRETIIRFHRPARAAGETKYSPIKLAKLAWTAISSFSAMPLKACLLAGLLLTVFGIGYSLYAVYAAIFVTTTVPGWSSIVCFQLLFNGATLTAVGLVGDYVGRIYDETKQRPLYVLGDSVNIQSSGCANRIVWINPPDATVEQNSHLFRPSQVHRGSETTVLRMDAKRAA